MNEKKKAQIISDCLEKVESGMWTEKTCWDFYPELKQELLDVFSVYHALLNYQGPQVSPQQMKKSKDRLMFKLVDRTETVTKSPQFRYRWQNTKRRFTMAWIIIVTMFLSLVSGGGVVYASNAALPGDTLYPVKTLVEDLQLAISPDANDVKLVEEFTGRRINELMALIEADKPEGMDILVDGYQNRTELTAQLMAKIESTNPDEALKLRTELETRFQEQARIIEEYIKESEGDADSFPLQQKLREMLQANNQIRLRINDEQPSITIEEKTTEEETLEVVEPDAENLNTNQNQNENRIQSMPEEFIENDQLKFQFRFEQNLEGGVYAEVGGARYSCDVEGTLATCNLTGVPGSGRMNLYKQDTNVLMYSFDYNHKFEYLWNGTKESGGSQMNQEGNPENGEGNQKTGKNGNK